MWNADHLIGFLCHLICKLQTINLSQICNVFFMCLRHHMVMAFNSWERDWERERSCQMFPLKCEVMHEINTVNIIFIADTFSLCSAKEWLQLASYCNENPNESKVHCNIFTLVPFSQPLSLSNTHMHKPRDLATFFLTGYFCQISKQAMICVLLTPPFAFLTW